MRNLRLHGTKQPIQLSINKASLVTAAPQASIFFQILPDTSNQKRQFTKYEDYVSLII
jgi:hypothetical protein